MNLKEWAGREGVHPVTAYRWFGEGSLPRLGRLKTHESTRKLARRIEAGTARILSATVRRDGGRWHVSLTCEVDRAERGPVRPADQTGIVPPQGGTSHRVFTKAH